MFALALVAGAAAAGVSGALDAALYAAPFLVIAAYADPAGWTRSRVEASNGSVERVVWTGSTASDGFAEFAFLAGTPGELQFKALQTYADGKVVRSVALRRNPYSRLDNDRISS